MASEFGWTINYTLKDGRAFNPRYSSWGADLFGRRMADIYVNRTISSLIGKK